MHPGVGVTSTLGGGVGRVITIENLTPTLFPPSLFYIPQTSHLPHAAPNVPRARALSLGFYPRCRCSARPRGGSSASRARTRRTQHSSASRTLEVPRTPIATGESSWVEPPVTTRVAPASARMVHPRPRLRAARQVIPSHPIPGKVLDPSMSQHFSSTRPAPGDAWHALDRARWNGGGDGSLRSAYHVWSCNDLHTPGC